MGMSDPDFSRHSAVVIRALESQDITLLRKRSQIFLEDFAFHSKKPVWRNFAQTAEVLPLLIGLEVSHFHLMKEMTWAERILHSSAQFGCDESVDGMLRRRWEMMCLPLRIFHIEREWGGCLETLVEQLADYSLSMLTLDAESPQNLLLHRAGVVTMAQLKLLMNQISQYGTLMGSVLSRSEASNEVRACLTGWFFAQPNDPVVPSGLV